jgi:hypothetical protein
VQPDTPEHAKQRKQILALIDKHGLSEHRDAIASLIKPAIGLQTRKAKTADSAVGVTRVGGEPDAPADFEWPDGDEGPLSFVMQVNLADVAKYDLESLLPGDGLLSLFSDPFADHVTVLHFDKRTALQRHAWVPEDAEPFTLCGVKVLPELQLPPHSSAFVSTRKGVLTLSDEQHRIYWDKVWLAWRGKQRPGDAGEAGIHQLLGYAVGDDTGEQGRDEEVLFGFDSDDRAAMEW